MSDPKFGLRCIDPDHAGRGYGNVYPLVAGQDRLHGLVGGVPCYELVASYDGGQTWMSAPSESAGVERLRERHVPTVAAASTPGVWNVYCAACSDAAQDYVQVCTAGRWQAPAQLVAYDLLVQARGDAVDAVQVVADLTSVLQPDGTYEPAAASVAGPTLCPVCRTQPIGHEGTCEP